MRTIFCHSLVLGLLTCLPCVRSLCAQSADESANFAEPRVWTDVTGQFSRVGTLVEVLGVDIRLRQPSGRGVTIARDKLCAADQQLVHKFEQQVVAQGASGPSRDEVRIWTDIRGRQAWGALVAANGDSLVLVKPSGQRATARLKRLSQEDQNFVRASISRGAANNFVARPISTSKPALRAIAGAESDGDAAAQGINLPTSRDRLVASLPFSVVPTWAQQSAPAKIIHLRVSRGFLEQFIPHDVNTTENVQDVIVGSSVSGTSTTHGDGSLVLLPDQQQVTADILFAGTSFAHTTSNGGRAQVISSSTTSFEARKRIVLDATGLHLFPTISMVCSSAQTCNICSALPGLRGAIARRVAARRTEKSQGQANQEAASHFEHELNRRLDHDIASSLSDIGGYHRLFFATARKCGLELRSQYTSTADQLDMAIFRRPSDPSQPEPTLPEIPGNPPAALWIHNSFLQQVIADPNLRSAIEPFAQQFLAASKPDTAGASQDRSSIGKV